MESQEFATVNEEESSFTPNVTPWKLHGELLDVEGVDAEGSVGELNWKDIIYESDVYVNTERCFDRIWIRLRMPRCRCFLQVEDLRKFTKEIAIIIC